MTELSPELIDRIAQRALVHGDREHNEETLLREWDELFPRSKDQIRKMVRDVLWAVEDVGLQVTPKPGSQIARDARMRALVEADRTETVLPGGRALRVPREVCRCPILKVGDFCPVHGG